MRPSRQLLLRREALAPLGSGDLVELAAGQPESGAAGCGGATGTACELSEMFLRCPESLKCLVTGALT